MRTNLLPNALSSSPYANSVGFHNAAQRATPSNLPHAYEVFGRDSVVLARQQHQAPVFSGKTALHIAARENDLDAVNRNLQNPDIDVDEADESDDHNTALHTNLNLRDGIPAPFLDLMEKIKGHRPKNENPNPKICRALLADGKAEPNSLDIHERTPFHIYLLRHPQPDREIVNTLLLHGTLVDFPDKEKRSALRNFVEKHDRPDPWTIQQCLERGAKLIGFPPESIARLKKALQTILPETEFKRYPQLDEAQEGKPEPAEEPSKPA